MRVPGVHVLLTAGVVAVTSIGTVAAFSLTGSSEAEQRLPSVAPPPAVVAPLDPAPLPIAPPAPAPAPVVAQDPTQEPTRASEPDPDRSAGENDDADTPERRPDRPDRSDDETRPEKPSRVKPDPDGTKEQKLAYACQNGMMDGPICRPYR